MLAKLGDVQGLMRLHLDNQKWDAALALAGEHPALAAQVYLPYAQWLAEHDRFDEAQDAFKQAGQPGQCSKLLQSLAHNAVLEHRYHDAGRYLWTLAKEGLVAAGEVPSAAEREEFVRHRQRADYYFGYHSIHK